MGIVVDDVRDHTYSDVWFEWSTRHGYPESRAVPAKLTQGFLGFSQQPLLESDQRCLP